MEMPRSTSSNGFQQDRSQNERNHHGPGMRPCLPSSCRATIHPGRRVGRHDEQEHNFL